MVTEELADHLYENFEVFHLIMSRGRHDLITTHKLLGEAANVLVPDDEVDAYREVLPEHVAIYSIPASIHGIGPVRNWIMENFPQHILVIYDDDIDGCAYIGYDHHTVLYNPKKFVQVIENAAICALDARKSLFSIAAFGLDVRKYRANKPFHLNTLVSAIYGIIGREHKWETRNKMRVDADFTLTHLLHDRIIWMDGRYSIHQMREKNRGGVARYRTAEAIEQEKRRLKEKWGPHIKFSSYRGIHKTSLMVKRQQSLQF